jgi:hypothetical protein
MTEAQYRAHPAINISRLKAFKRSPAHVLAGFEFEREPTAAMKLGSLLDHRVLGTPYLWTTSPFDSFRTKDAQAWRDEQDARGVTVFSQDDVACVDSMVASLKIHPIASRILSKGKSQVPLIAGYESPGGKVCDRKGLVDWVPDGTKLLVDLKKTADASAFGFGRQAMDLCYHAQAAYYLSMWKALHDEERQWLWICVEDKAPFAVAVYSASPAMIEHGENLWRSWLNQFLECTDTDHWPGYNGDDIVQLELPKWAREGGV